MIIILCLIVHVIIIAACLVLRLIRILKCEYIMLLIAFWVPVWGVLMLIYKGLNDRRIVKFNHEKYQVEVEKMKTDVTRNSVELDERKSNIVPINEALLVNDSRYREELLKDLLYEVNSSIVIDSDDVVEKVVPLQEAMLMNDSGTRRTLVMDVLYSNPSDYISQLTEAKTNEDSEVVHYAVTALVELQKEFDIKFQDLQRRMDKDPEDDALEKEYLNLQERYIFCGLLEGDGLKTQQLSYRDRLKKVIGKGNHSWMLQSKLADMDLLLQDTMSLQNDINVMTEKWPDKDEIYEYQIQLAVLRKDAEQIREIIKEIQRKEIYISSGLNDLIQFWSEK